MTTEQTTTARPTEQTATASPTDQAATASPTDQAATASPAACPATPGAGPVGGSGTAGSGRLPNGELRRLTAEFLANDPAGAYRPGVIADRLGGRSSGAVLKACEWLADRGAARRVDARPASYQATATTRDHAVATTGTAPAPGPGSAAGPGGSGSDGGGADPSGVVPGGDTGTAGTGSGGAPGAAGSGDPVAVVPVVRPSGQSYYPRELGGISDVEALRAARTAGIPVLLYGPPGTGKTSLAEGAFPDLITLAGDGDTSAADLVGEYTQTPEGRYVFVDGPLTRAMKQGRALLVDDATLISPAELAVLYPAMDGRGEITVKGSGETVTAQPGFYVVAGHNPGVHGAILTDALNSRFSLQVRVSSDYDLATTLGVDPRAVRVARALARRQTIGEVDWAPQLRELLAFRRISEALGAQVAIANLVGVCPEADREAVVEAVRSAFGRNVDPLALGAQLGGTPAPPRTKPPR